VYLKAFLDHDSDTQVEVSQVPDTVVSDHVAAVVEPDKSEETLAALCRKQPKAERIGAAMSQVSGFQDAMDLGQVITGLGIAQRLFRIGDTQPSSGMWASRRKGTTAKALLIDDRHFPGDC
jgi:hypothetical protein